MPTIQEQPNSRNIPYPIKREVRQRCGFGCVICGLPIYEYEHMEEWAQVKRHVATEITLLCDQHHREKTAGLLPKSVVKAANEEPYNIRCKASKPYLLHYSGDFAEVKIGGNSFKAYYDNSAALPVYGIIIDGVPLIGFVMDRGELLLNILLFDRFNRPLLEVRENQLLYMTDIWDVELIGTSLILREQKNDIHVELKFMTPNHISIIRGKLMYNGVQLNVNKDSIAIAGNNLKVGKNISIGDIGLVIGRPNLPGAFRFPDINRYPTFS